MSILETFYILFEADAKAVKKGAQEAGTATDQLEKKIQHANLATTQLGKSFQSLIGVATSALAGVLSVGALVSGVARAITNASEISKSANALKIEFDELQAWSEAAKRAGGSGTIFRKSLIELNQKLADFAKTGRGEIGLTLQQLGVNFRNLNGSFKSAPELLLHIAKSFERLSQSESVELGKKLGLDETTIALLQKGQQAIEDQIKQHKALGVLNKADAQITKQYTEQLEKNKVALDNLGQVFRYLFTTTAVTVMPALTWLLKKFEVFTSYLAQHRDFVKGFFIGLAAVLTTLYLPAVLKAASATLALVAPYLLIGAAIAAVSAAFALAYEDVMNFLDGNDSLLGELTKRWPLLGEVVRAVAHVFSFLFELVKAGLTLIVDLIDAPEKALERFSVAVQAMFDRLLNKIPALKSSIGAIGGVFNQVGNTVKSVWGGITAAIDTAIGTASQGVKVIGNAIDKVKSFFGISQAANAQNGSSLGTAAVSANKTALMAGAHFNSPFCADFKQHHARKSQREQKYRRTDRTDHHSYASIRWCSYQTGTQQRIRARTQRDIKPF